MAYGYRDAAIILRHPKFKKSQTTNTFHYERKKVFEQGKTQGKTKSNHKVLGLL